MSNRIVTIIYLICDSTFYNSILTFFSVFFPRSSSITQPLPILFISLFWAWLNGNRHRKWSQRAEFKSWMKLFTFCFALIPFGKSKDRSLLYSLLWLLSDTDIAFYLWCGDWFWRRKILNSNYSLRGFLSHIFRGEGLGKQRHYMVLCPFFQRLLIDYFLLI